MAHSPSLETQIKEALEDIGNKLFRLQSLFGGFNSWNRWNQARSLVPSLLKDFSRLESLIKRLEVQDRTKVSIAVIGPVRRKPTGHHAPLTGVGITVGPVRHKPTHHRPPSLGVGGMIEVKGPVRHKTRSN